MSRSPAKHRSFGAGGDALRRASSHRLPDIGAISGPGSFTDDNSTSTAESTKSGSTKYGRVNVVQEAKNDLVSMKACMRRDNSRVLTRVSSLGPSDYVDNARLGSLDQVRDDLRKDELESYFKRHKKKDPSNLSMAEKRNLRKWFLKMDTDGSGEVGVDELQDPLLSAGVFKTRADIESMLKTVDMNEDNEVTFDNFLRAVSNSKSCNRDKMKNLQVMSSDKHFSMDTLLSQERRKSLLKGIVDDAQVRQQQQESVLNEGGESGSLKMSKKMREAMLREHDDQLNDHNDFVNSLESVLADKFRLLKHRREALNGGGGRGRRQKEKMTAAFSFSDNNSDGSDSNIKNVGQIYN
jgi:hypothetical protein